MTNPPRVSIIIPAYGRPDHLNQAVRSVIDQTYAKYELIVVDDGSGPEITSRYQLPPSAKLICMESRSGGPAQPRNDGIAIAQGEYIAFLDQDDIWLPEKLARQVAQLDQNPDAGLVYCHYVRVDDSLRPLDRQPDPIAVSQDPVRQLLDQCFIVSPTTTLIRRDVPREVGGFDPQLIGTSDWDLLIRIAAKHRLISDPTPLALYRTHPSQTSQDKITMSRGHINMLEKLMPTILANRPDLVTMLRRHLAHRYRQRADALLEIKHDRRGAAGALFTAMRIWPWRWEVYRRLLAVAAGRA